VLYFLVLPYGEVTRTVTRRLIVSTDLEETYISLAKSDDDFGADELEDVTWYLLTVKYKHGRFVKPLI
jgi:hypothetical protein